LTSHLGDTDEVLPDHLAEILVPHGCSDRSVDRIDVRSLPRGLAAEAADPGRAWMRLGRAT
jgi:hypothetical protein